MVTIRLEIEKNTLFRRAFVRVRAKIMKNPCGKALARVRAKIEEIILFGRALVEIRSEIEKNTLFGMALVRVRAK